MATSTIVTIVLYVIGFLLKWFKAGDEKLKWFEQIVEKNKDAGNVSAETAARLVDMHNSMREEYARMKAEKNKVK